MKRELRIGALHLILFIRIIGVGFIILILFTILDVITESIFIFIGRSEVFHQRIPFSTFGISITEIYLTAAVLLYLSDCLEFLYHRFKFDYPSKTQKVTLNEENPENNK